MGREAARSPQGAGGLARRDGRDGPGGYAAVLELLKKHFGYDRFLPLQESIIDSVMAGRDTFALMPTGGGKSLCYQLPALALPGLTLVVSPLIALMKDQVDALRANGIPADFVNSTMTAAGAAEVQRRAADGRVKLLYVAPERAELPEFRHWLAAQSVSLIAIDEAHCVSMWGHDFRPAYRKLSQLREAAGPAPVIALTATATPQVRQDILSQLGLRQPGVFVSSFNRPNLTYSVQPKKGAQAALLALLERHRRQSAIIYCQSRKSTEEMANWLAQQGFQAEAYHAGLDAGQRLETQNRFIRDETHIVVATIAFGMGIDKPDVRLVAHYDLPGSVEGYYQETGRAGRDGQPSDCVAFYSYADKSKQEYFIGRLEDETERERAQWRLEQVLSLYQRRTCRRRFVLNYLGEDWDEANCGGCDNCLRPTEQYDATEPAQKLLSAAIRTGQRFGVRHLAAVLLGHTTSKVLERGHDKLPVFGIEQDFSLDELRDLAEDLKSEGLLETLDGEYASLLVTDKGRAFLKNRETLTLTRPIKTASESQRPLHRPRLPEDGAAYDAGLFRELSALRKRLADERGVPAFVIFSNRSLEDMARRVPRSVAEFAQVSGVGQAKLNDFGGPFLELIGRYAEQHGLEPPAAQPSMPDNLRQSRLPQEERTPREVSLRVRETGRIVSGGASLAQAAAAQGVSEDRVTHQLERLVQAGIPVELWHLLPPPARRMRIETALRATGGELLKPARELLGEDYGYIELRLVRMVMRQRRAAAPV